MRRRWITDRSGEQLTARQISAWSTVFEHLSETERPDWYEDPVFELAQRIFAEHGTFAGLVFKRNDHSDESQLARELVFLRRALYGGGDFVSVISFCLYWDATPILHLHIWDLQMEILRPSISSTFLRVFFPPTFRHCQVIHCACE